MQKQELLRYDKKLVRITCNNGYNFSGRILELNETSLVLLDIYNSHVTINYSDVMFLFDVPVKNKESKA